LIDAFEVDQQLGFDLNCNVRLEILAIKDERFAEVVLIVVNYSLVAEDVKDLLDLVLDRKSPELLPFLLVSLVEERDILPKIDIGQR
jgi:hypothetical protein